MKIPLLLCEAPSVTVWNPFPDGGGWDSDPLLLLQGKEMHFVQTPPLLPNHPTKLQYMIELVRDIERKRDRGNRGTEKKI